MRDLSRTHGGTLTPEYIQRMKEEGVTEYEAHKILSEGKRIFVLTVSAGGISHFKYHKKAVAHFIDPKGSTTVIAKSYDLRSIGTDRSKPSMRAIDMSTRDALRLLFADELSLSEGVKYSTFNSLPFKKVEYYWFDRACKCMHSAYAPTHYEGSTTEKVSRMRCS